MSIYSRGCSQLPFVTLSQAYPLHKNPTMSQRQRTTAAIAIASLNALGSFTVVEASDCWKDLRGREYCDISPGARAGIGLGIVAAILAVFFLMKAILSRRARRKNRAHDTPISETVAASDAPYATLPSCPPPTPASVPRCPSPVYEAQTPYLSYLPAKPPAYTPPAASTPPQNLHFGPQSDRAHEAWSGQQRKASGG
ncbi:hypothetical protein C8Q77DRAFT_1209892 [Trametes polyzona]|nr:hypothetical protein C8Q77DRAFT_1209892 [Trametes polyzona]